MPLNRAKLAIQNAKTAFYEFCWPKAIRWYKLPNTQVRGARYPAPGSETIQHDHMEFDYKTAYRDSKHNIRYYNNYKYEDQVDMFMSDAIGQTPQEKLVYYGYLDKSQMDNQEAFQKAAQQYQDELGVPVEQRFHLDTAGMIERPLEKGNRESVAQLVRTYFGQVRDHNASEAYSNNLEDLYRPQMYILKSYDMLADDPVLRQCKVDIELQIENFTQARLDAGSLPIFKGDPNYWKVLDNSFDTENIKMVQSSVGDSVTELDTEVLNSQHNKEIRHKYENLTYPIRNRVYPE